MKIFFFHHAGGDRYAFRKLQPLLEQSGYQPHFHDLPGHGERFNEKLLSDLSTITNDAFEKLEADLNGDFAFFGSSMGTVLAWQLAGMLREKRMRLPAHIFLASRMSPDSYHDHPRIADFDSDAFWQYISGYGGCPQALIDHRELREVFETMMRADFTALAGYYPAKPVSLPVEATVMIGRDDRYSAADMEGWQPYFDQEVTINEFDGGHFFFQEGPDRIFQLIDEKLGAGKTRTA